MHIKFTKYNKRRSQVFRVVLLIVAVFSQYIEAKSQLFDSLKIDGEITGSVSSQKYQPFWNTANQFGKISTKQFDLSSGLIVTNKNVLLKFENGDDDQPVEHYKELAITYGASIYNNGHFNNTFVEQLFGKIEYEGISLRVGRFEEIIGEVDHDLSSGSLAISGNAIPIPKLGIAFTQYKNVPFTNGWIQVKGTFAHGWWGTDRFLRNAYYHEKSFFARLGAGKLKLYGGLEHFAEWGGHRGAFTADRSFKGFLNVVFVRQADDGSVGTSINGIAPSRAGDQRGCLEAGMDYESNTAFWHGYAQMPFESGEEIDPRNRSFLSGLSYTPKESSIIKLLLEFLYTKEMNYWVGLKQRNSYYNNGEYRTGWEYENRVVGTPLFLNRAYAYQYFPNFKPFSWDGPDKSIPGNQNIVDNRVVAIHTGGIYRLNDAIIGKTLLTYTQNYGTYATNEFSKGKTQFYTLQEFTFHNVDSRWNLKATIGLDFGDLKGNIALEAGFRYQLL